VKRLQGTKEKIQGARHKVQGTRYKEDLRNKSQEQAKDPRLK